MSRPATQMRPSPGSSSRRSSRMNVVFPEPDGPTRKTNSPFSISIDTSRNAIEPLLYVLVTFSNRIIEQVLGGMPQPPSAVVAHEGNVTLPAPVHPTQVASQAILSPRACGGGAPPR